MNKNHGKCSLCLKSRDLKQSHIIPRLLSKSIRKSPSKVYTIENGKSTSITQDTKKERLLCEECEGKLNKFETYYSNHFKYPDYNSNLYDFLLSILWRVAELNAQQNDDFARREFNSYVYWKEDARAYLDMGIVPKKFPKLYLFYLEKGTNYDFLMHMGTYFSNIHNCKVSLLHRFIDGHSSYDLLCERDDHGDINVIISNHHDLNDYPISIQNIFIVENKHVIVAASENLITCIAIDGEEIKSFINYEIPHGNGVIPVKNIPQEVNKMLSYNLIGINWKNTFSDEDQKTYDIQIQKFFQAQNKSPKR
ncbi:MAG: hypothetical protein LBV80_09530 [Deltaproteobacteria bacterium]|nr:hypothetical protein [Deltaproteobacteria bacterium]